MRLSRIDIAGLICVGLMLVAQDAYSDTWVDIHLGSKHMSSDGWYSYQDGERVNHEWNERNLGIGVDHDITHNVSALAGVFVNSFHILTYYAGFDLHTSRAKPIQVGVSVGPLKGYEDTIMPVKFMAQPNLVAEIGDARIKFGWLPGAILEEVTGEEHIDVLTLSVGFRF